MEILCRPDHLISVRPSWSKWDMKTASFTGAAQTRLQQHIWLIDQCSRAQVPPPLLDLHWLPNVSGSDCRHDHLPAEQLIVAQAAECYHSEGFPSKLNNLSKDSSVVRAPPPRPGKMDIPIPVFLHQLALSLSTLSDVPDIPQCGRGSGSSFVSIQGLHPLEDAIEAARERDGLLWVTQIASSKGRTKTTRPGLQRVSLISGTSS
ncbi:unnamed protein product [Pleuronectes platessa]|uniref:Uncharacterized protein n=1 Tax=Pleuronectes platessa TaxID=8262 RepID=A0A9N7VFL9_PLEPL|nr:unnamed protein product [Pleuronectes platessa]